MMSEIIATDYELFYLINGLWRTDWLDALLPYWRKKEFWIPAYALLAGILLYRFRWKGFYFLLLIGLTIAIADQTSSSLIKPAVQRLRPCREPALDPPAVNIVHCGGGFSFPSSHATNHFALGMLLFLTWGRKWGRWRWLLLLWAATIAYAQVYVGVHFPVDVLAGSLLGSLIGGLLAWGYRRAAGWHIDAFYHPSPGS